MELPINDKELATIVSALRLGGDAALYQKINTIKKIRETTLIHIKKWPAKNLDLLFNGFFKRDCKRDWR